MLALIICAVCVSLSNFALPKETSGIVEVRVDETTTPIYFAVLSSFCMPVSCACFAFMIKYVQKNLKLNPIDYTMGFWFIMSAVIQIAAIIYFTRNKGIFETRNWVSGSIGSIANLIGCKFIIRAYNSDGAPYGAIAAFS